MSQGSESFNSGSHPEQGGHDLFGQALLVLLLTGSLLLLYAGVFSVGISDDVFFSRAANGAYDLALASYVNGRFVAGAVYQVFAWAGADVNSVWTIAQYFAFLTFAAFAVVFVRCLNLPLTRLETLLGAGLIVTLPYAFFLLASKNNAVNAILAFASTGAAIHFHSRLTGWVRAVVPGCFLFACLSSYQTTIYYFFVFVCGFAFFHGSTRRTVVTSVASGIAATLLAVVAYLVIYRITLDWALLRIAESANPELSTYFGKSRAQFNSLQAFNTAVLYYVFSIGRVLLAPEPILPVVVKLTGLGIFLIGYWFWGPSQRLGAAPSEIELFLQRKRHLMILALLALAGSPIHLVINDIWFTPRIFAHAGAIWAILMLSALLLAPPNWRGRFTVGVAIMLIGFAASTLKVAQGTSRQYTRDLALAHKILAELNQKPGFNPELPIAVVGHIHRNSPYMANSWTYFNLNTSRFTDEWSKRRILELAADRAFAIPGPAFLSTAEAICAKDWHGEDYVRTAVTPLGAAVCLR